MISAGMGGALLLIAVWVGADPNTKPPPGYAGGCTDGGCHASVKQGISVHNPVAEGSCDACHETDDEAKHTFTYVAEGGELCLECHDEFEGKTVHSPVEAGECTTCHSPHAGKGQHLLIETSVADVCAECHEEVLDDLDFLHGPVAAGACTACHSPHVSEHGKLLLATEPDLCVKCHAGIAERLTKKKTVHPPVKTGCTECHQPHGAANKMMLSAEPPDLCLDCHDTIAELAEDASVKHAALDADGTCANCHDPHGSDEAKLLAKKPMDLCLGCHNKELGEGKEKTANITKLLAENKNHHGPILDKDCTSCHAAQHGGEHANLLSGKYPTSFYAAFDEDLYALCFDCHDVEMFEEAQTDEATGFRNGERNLHYLHVNRAKKGRTCRACHNVHGSKTEKLITDGAPFGEWLIPINFVQTAGGGSCQPGCHRQYRYDRESPVTNLR